MKEYLYRKRIAELQQKLLDERAKNRFQENTINSMTNSRSWKITKPLRKISVLLSSKKDSLKTIEENYEYSYSYKEVPTYDSEYQKDINFENCEALVKTIAFYLPQYHTFPENDKWWGKGFTDWTNTKKAKPRFENHYQPREPHKDFGYYDLTNIESLKKQIELAKRHKIYGFSFYYYWFSEKRLLEKPLDLYLEHPELDFPFLLCWANENWTRTWDGLDKEVLMAQKYSEEDPKFFIRDIKKYFDDKRYIRINGNPVLLVYNPKQIPNFKDVCEKWREAARELGIGEIVIWSNTAIGLKDYTNTSFVDGEFDFAPHGFSLPNDKVTGIEGSGTVVNYSKLVNNLWDTYNEHFPLKPFNYSITMGWDNSARRKSGFSIYHNYSLQAFYNWTTMAMKKMHENNFDDTFLFINAWNEWAEGSYLEPDKKYGYANINTLSKAICGIPYKANFKLLEKKENKVKNKKIAIQCHVFYVDLLYRILKEISKIPTDFDLFISTDSEEKQKEIKKIMNQYERKINYDIKVYPNKGRDILPMILQLKSKYQNYDYLLHVHTKKSLKIPYGNQWREYLYYNLLGSETNINSILNKFESEKNIGLISPIPFEEAFYLLINRNRSLSVNAYILEKLFTKMEIPLEEINSNVCFPIGSMFWAKTDAIKQLFTNLDETDFENEKGQLDGTMAHAVERSFEVLAKRNNYESIETKNTF